MAETGREAAPDGVKTGRQETGRRTNIDWLRVKLMCLVIVLHYLYTSDALPVRGTAPEKLRFFGMFLEAFAIIAVNVWVLLSGYLRVQAPFRAGRFASLVCAVLFYGVLIYTVAYGSGFAENEAGLFGWVQALFPVSGGAYWFMTSYLLLYLLTPFLNAGLSALRRDQLRTVILLLLVWSALIKSVVPVYFAPDDMGYGLQWFICLYLCGAYMRLYHPVRENGPDIRALTVYVCSSLAVFALTSGLYLFHARTGRLAHFAGVPFHYNFVLNLVGAIAFFRWFLSIRLPQGAFAKAGAFLAPHVTGVYLLHAHPVLFDRWAALTARVTGEAPRDSLPRFFLHMVVTVLIVFFAGIAADMVRGALFDAAVKAARGFKKA